VSQLKKTRILSLLIVLALILIAVLAIVYHVARHVKGGRSAQVVEKRERSVTEDPAVRGEFPNDWLVADAGAGLPHPPPAESEIPEFFELFKHTRTPGLVEAELSPGATRTVSLQVSGPSGLATSAKWIGTTSPLNVTIALNGSILATGTAYHYGLNRGGSYVQTQTTAGGLATISVTNSSNATVKVNIRVHGYQPVRRD
jgi:hypothetical protein